MCLYSIPLVVLKHESSQEFGGMSVTAKVPETPCCVLRVGSWDLTLGPARGPEWPGQDT